MQRLLLKQGKLKVANQKTKKNKKEHVILHPFKMDYNVLKEPLEEFKERLIGMPMFLLLNEYRILCEQFGIEVAKTQKDWSDTHSKIHERVSLVREEIMKTVHTLHDQMLAADYYTEQEWARGEKEKKNVEVSKKSNKQN
jgi:GTPase involved in cell partitioning and DNA repair